MNPHLQRGLLLYEQERHPQAEAEFRQAVSVDPQDAYTRAMLALTLSQQERYKEAEAEIAEGLKNDPGFPFIHYARALILQNRERLPEAQSAISEAIELDPNDADFRALQSQIYLNQRKWAEALESAEMGLGMDPEHVGCTNLRAVALVKLGRKEEAGRTIDSALAKNPQDSFTHANQGWTLLHAGQHDKALEHFRESLRLDPGNEWARQGTIEALKAKNFVYAVLLKYFLWMSRLSSQMQWGIILGGYFGSRMLASLSRENPAMRPYVLPIQILYLLFVFLTWTADPLFNLLLRLNKFGRHVLNRQEIVASNWVGGFVALALICLVAGFLVNSSYLLGAFVFGFSVLPLSAVFKCQPGWPRMAMAAYTVVVAGCGIGALFIQTTGVALKEPRAALFTVFLIGILGSGWIANLLLMQRVRK